MRFLFRRVYIRYLLLVPALLFGLFLIYDRLYPFRAHVPYATQLRDRDGVLLHAFLSADDKWRFFSETEEITPLLRKTLLFKEDRFFPYHPGVNPVALLRAFGANILAGKRTSGASTITMQVARLLEPRPRTYASKIIELVHALQLEWHYSKDEILQLYLNLVPFGGNIEGIKAASLLYYGKKPELLSLSEITTLTIIPNSPTRLRPGKNNTALLNAKNKWLRRFLDENLFPETVIRDALAEPVTASRRQPPRKAPHLAFRLQQASHTHGRIETSLRHHSQSLTENLVANYVNRVRSLQIHNAAALVVNNETLEVEAYVGSADFDNPEDGGQVDGVRAIRSPGSTLKPLLYAAAFDMGLVTPKTVLNDVPSTFSSFEPENFDRKFQGPVSVEFALANSLNIPAVKILSEIQPKTFIGLLKKAGFQTVAQQSASLGLSMILGGCGVTLEELTRAFACFARDGQWAPLRFTPHSAGDTVAGAPLYSPEAAYMVTQILAQANRPDLPTNFDHTYRLPRIAWKTGTSYGKRDAWSIGYNARYTIGVWIGNFSGEGVPELSGANIATPLLFELFNSLDYNSARRQSPVPDNLRLRKVCAVSGDVPSEFCDQQVTGYFIPGISPHRLCRHRKWVFTDKNERVSYCSYCLPADGYTRKRYPNLAPELISFYNISRIPYEKIPPHNPACDRVFEDGAPLITSPSSGAEYFLQVSGAQQLQLSCQAAVDVTEVMWFLNDRPVGKAAPSEPVFVAPPAGPVKISCSDDKGRNTDIHIVVRQL